MGESGKGEEATSNRGQKGQRGERGSERQTWATRGKGGDPSL